MRTLSVLCVLLHAGSALAQAAPAAQPEQQPAQAAPRVTAPRLLKFVEANYPPEAQAQGLQARVELELVIGVDGRVQEARVATPAGHGFDEAALAAARAFEFAPATKDGEPIAARVRYPYVFEIRTAPLPPPEPEAPPPAARLEGVILDADGEQPFAGAQVIVNGAALPEPLIVRTDAGGRFVFDDLPAGSYSVTVQAQDRLPREQQEVLIAGEATSVIYRVEELPDEEAFSVTARIPPPPREVTRRTIGKAQLTRIPGTRGDALRTVELMPGVARPPLGSGVLIVRGSAPEDSQTLLEGLPVPLLYHFGGLTSFVNSRLLDSIEFYPGNFSVRYGRRRGGVVDVEIGDIPRDGVHGVVDVNLIDASLLVQTPVGEDAEVALAARRSHVDVVFESLVPSDDIATVAAPVYYDYQAIGTWRPGDDDELRLMVFGSSDQLELLFEQPLDVDPAVAGDFDIGTQFHRGHVSWRKRLSDDVDQDVDIAVGTVDVNFGLGEQLAFSLQGVDIYARSEWRGRVSDRVRLIGGLDLYFLPGEYTYIGPPPGSSESNPNTNAGGASLSNLDSIEAVDEFTVVQPAVYFETELSFHPLRVVLGSRVDYFAEIDEFSYDPRASAHYQLTDTTQLKAGIGLFSQPPQFQESDPFLGNPDLEPTRTLHVSGGVEQDVTDSFNVGVDGFYKHLYDRVVGTPTGAAPRFTNLGEGRVYGAELSMRIDPKGRFFGYLSYTLSRSERRDPGDAWVPFEFDQTHILTTAGVLRLGNGWEAGATFRLVSGNLDTPVIGASEDLVTGLYSPVFGRVNSRRNPTFHRLDVRIEKLWDFDAWKAALYLDLQNAYNAKNVEGQTCDFEYRVCEDIQGLPIFPVFGVRGEI